MTIHSAKCPKSQGYLSTTLFYRILKGKLASLLSLSLCLGFASACDSTKTSVPRTPAKKVTRDSRRADESQAERKGKCLNIFNGQEATPEVEASTVLILSPTSSCSGTLIADNLLVTAGHCVASMGPNATVRFGKDGLVPTRKCPLISLTTHDEYNKGTPRSDLALGIFSCAEGLPPGSKIVPVVNAGPADMQAPYTVAGYGISQHGASKWLLLEMKATIQQVDPVQMVFYSQSPTTHVCPGDSGGPVYLDKDGVRYLAGVISGGMPGQAPSCGGPLGKITNLHETKYVKWIQDQIATHGKKEAVPAGLNAGGNMQESPMKGEQNPSASVVTGGSQNVQPNPQTSANVGAKPSDSKEDACL